MLGGTDRCLDGWSWSRLCAGMHGLEMDVKCPSWVNVSCPLAAFTAHNCHWMAVLGKCSCKKCTKCLHYHTVLIGHIDRYFVARFQKRFSKMSWYHFSRTVEHCGIFAWWWIQWQSRVAASALSHLLISQVWMPQWNRYLSTGLFGHIYCLSV